MRRKGEKRKGAKGCEKGIKTGAREKGGREWVMIKERHMKEIEEKEEEKEKRGDN